MLGETPRVFLDRGDVREALLSILDTSKILWDDAIVLDGEIGKNIVVARRLGADWFIGAITNMDAMEITTPLTFLEEGKKYQATIYYDDPKLNAQTNVGIETHTVNNKKELKYSLLPSGGVAIKIEPVK